MGDAKGDRSSRLTKSPRPSSGLCRDGVSRTAWLAVASGRSHLLDARSVLHMQRAAGNAWVSRVVAGPGGGPAAPVRAVVGSGRGSPLEHSLREDMESRFGHDFGSVRVHTDAAATESARSLSAHAYTVGEDIVFQGGAYNPHTEAGKQMLAHELVHVVQQRSGPVAGTPAAGGIVVSHPADPFEQEADRIAHRLARPGGGADAPPALTAT